MRELYNLYLKIYLTRLFHKLLTFYFFLFKSPLEDPGLALQNNKNFLPGHLMIRHGLSLK